MLDRSYIQSDTTGFDTFAEHARTISWDDILDATGLTREEIEEVHQRVLNAKSVIVCWAMGITQQKHGVASIREICNFLMLRGNIGKPGAGVCPVRGHSNVQGDRTMGVWEQMSQEFLDALGTEFNFTPPAHHGLDAINGIRAMRDGKAHVFVGVAGNFARDDMLRYIQTGFAGISAAAADRLCNYARLWNIRYSRWNCRLSCSI